jgi:autotransporter passenger strand-loop-strand repeat protein
VNVPAGAINSGGLEIVSSGGADNSATLSGGNLQVYAGGTGTGEVVDSGGNLQVGLPGAGAGGRLISATINSGGVEFVISGGAASGTTAHRTRHSRSPFPEPLITGRPLTLFCSMRRAAAEIAASGAIERTPGVAEGWKIRGRCNRVLAAVTPRRSRDKRWRGTLVNRSISWREASMRIHWTVIAGVAVALSMPAQAQQQTGLAAAADAMGAARLASIQYTGSGSNFFFGQAYEPGQRWPRFVQRVYTAAIDYQAPAMRLVRVRSQGEHPPRGGGAQAVGADQTAIDVVNGKFAWQEGGERAIPNPAAAQDRLLQLWATPHGAIKAALANAARLDSNIATFKVEGREFKLTLSPQNLVEKVSYLSTNEVIGDYPIEIAYTDYADFGGVKFPRHIVQTEDCFPTLDITVGEVKPNAVVPLDIPGNVRNAPPPPERPALTVDKLADGVWALTSPNARNWAVEFADHVVVVEGIGSEARSLAAMDEIAKLIPNKPIRYVINTHAHYDHSGGLRTYPAKGVTVVTHEMNMPFFEKVWARPRTIAPDLLSKSPRPLAFETVSDKKILTDGKRTIELYHMKGTSHNVANLLVYMPNEKLVYWGDGYNPPEGSDPRDTARTPEQMIDLYRVITQNKLDVRTVAPAHGAGPRPYENLLKAIGLIPL